MNCDQRPVGKTFLIVGHLGHNHTERQAVRQAKRQIYANESGTHLERQASHQASASSEASDLCNGSGTHLERQGKCHHRLPLVMLPLPLLLSLDAPLDARCGYAFRG